MSLDACQAKQGYGDSEDENAARYYLDNNNKISKLNSPNSRILEHCCITFYTLSSYHYLKIDKFKNCCLEHCKIIK